MLVFADEIFVRISLLRVFVQELHVRVGRRRVQVVVQLFHVFSVVPLGPRNTEEPFL
jgi:hypothetical protein